MMSASHAAVNENCSSGHILDRVIQNRFNLARLRDGVKPFRVHWFARLGSTNDRAAVMRRAGDLYAPAIVLAGKQTRGRGRGDNVWHSAGGSLTVTFALPIDPQLAPHQLPLIAGLAARNAVAELTGDNGVQLKWPNDLVYGQQKVGGLLCERIDKADLIGLGLNVNLEPAEAPLPLRQRITSLRAIARRPIDMTLTLITVAGHLRSMLARGAERPFGEILREYDSHHSLIGRRVSVIVNVDEPPITGKVEGLDEMGRLIVRDRGERHAIIAGHVVL